MKRIYKYQLEVTDEQYLQQLVKQKAYIIGNTIDNPELEYGK